METKGFNSVIYLSYVRVLTLCNLQNSLTSVQYFSIKFILNKEFKKKKNFGGIIHVLKNKHISVLQSSSSPFCSQLSVPVRCGGFSQCVRQQENIRKRTTLLLEGSLGYAPSSNLVAFLCPVTSSTISYQLHSLHISSSLLRDDIIWENIRQLSSLGRAGAGYSHEKPSPRFLVIIYTVLCTFGVFLIQDMGTDRSGSLLCVVFRFQTPTPSKAELQVQGQAEMNLERGLCQYQPETRALHQYVQSLKEQG